MQQKAFSLYKDFASSHLLTPRNKPNNRRIRRQEEKSKEKCEKAKEKVQINQGTASSTGHDCQPFVHINGDFDF